jgi:hypothetical protein
LVELYEDEYNHAASIAPCLRYANSRQMHLTPVLEMTTKFDSMSVSDSLSMEFMNSRTSRRTMSYYRKKLLLTMVCASLIVMYLAYPHEMQGLENVVRSTTVKGETRNEEPYILQEMISEPSGLSEHVVQLDGGSDKATPNDNEEEQQQHSGSGENKKLILLWSDFDENSGRWSSELHEFDSNEPFVNNQCAHVDCVLTLNKSKLAETQFVMFYESDGPGWPEKRYPGQIYVHVLGGNPPSHHEWLKTLGYDAAINLTMNYRRDSDLYHFGYGLQRRSEIISGEYVSKWPVHSKTKDVFWMASNCQTSSHREDYANELGKYIGVDVYGQCGNYTCPMNETEQCFEHLQQQYKYYLAFENSMCDGYITEEVFDPLRFEIVPIVLGKVDYKMETPPDSVIDIRDFQSPKALAEYLRELAANAKSYNAYFQWKQSYRTDFGSGISQYCSLCDGLHNPELSSGKSTGGYYDWWLGGCDNAFMDRMREQGGW